MLVGDRSGAGDTEETLTHEEKLRRERQRNLATGVTQYMWCVFPQTLCQTLPLTCLRVWSPGLRALQTVPRGC